MHRGLEQALDQMEAERAAKAGAGAPGEAAAPDAAPSPRDTRKVMMRGRKAAAWRHLTLPERDALTVLTAICKVRAGAVRVQELRVHKTLFSIAMSFVDPPHAARALTVLTAICKARAGAGTVQELRVHKTLFSIAMSFVDPPHAARALTALTAICKARAALQAFRG